MTAEAEPRDTRAELLAAAAEEFARHGAHGARIHAIVKRSGVNERMIYHHFGSKDGLYRAVLADHWTNVGGAWERVLARASGLEPRAGLKLAFSALFDLFGRRPLMIPLAIHESLSGWKALPQATLADVPRQVRELYARGQEDGVFRRDCAFETVYLTVMGALASVNVVAPRFSDLRERGRKDPGRLAGLADQMIDLVLDGASRPGEASENPGMSRRRK